VSALLYNSYLRKDVYKSHSYPETSTRGILDRLVKKLSETQTLIWCQCFHTSYTLTGLLIEAYSTEKHEPYPQQPLFNIELQCCTSTTGGRPGQGRPFPCLSSNNTYHEQHYQSIQHQTCGTCSRDRWFAVERAGDAT